jgi:hypothetical protein
MTASTHSDSVRFDPTSLEKTVQNILASRRITRADQQRLMALCMAAINNQQTMVLMNQISEALRVGRLRVVD